jgi:hypothetical protein
MKVGPAVDRFGNMRIDITLISAWSHSYYVTFGESESGEIDIMGE